MKKWYCILQGRTCSKDYGDHWTQIYKTFVIAEDKKGAIAAFHEHVNVEKIPLAVRKKVLNPDSLLLHVYEIKEGHFTEEFTYERTCIICGKTYQLIDKFNEFGSYGTYTCCSEECDGIERSRRVGPIETFDDFLSAMPVIYKITHTPTGKVYIGKTIRAFTLRWWEHIKSTGATDKFHTEIHNTPLTDWTFQVIEVLPKNTTNESILSRERDWIKHYNAIELGFNTI